MKHVFRAALVAAVVILPANFASAQPNAAAQNAAQTESMVVAPRRSLGSGAEIHTSGYSLTPDFSYPEGGGQPAPTRWKVPPPRRSSSPEIYRCRPP